VATAVLAGAVLTGLLIAQGAAPQGQTPAAQALAAGRGGAEGQRGAAAPPAGRQGGGGRRGGFTQFTRPLAPQDVLVRGKGLYEANCASCHAVDLRGSASVPNLLRSGVALRDEKGELVTAAVAAHTPRLTLIEADTVAIAEYIHSVHATMGGQGSPPGRNPTGITLNVLVGDAAAGAAEFKARCASCHSVTGDLAGIGTKQPDARALQNAWVQGSASTFGGGRGGGGGGGNAVTVTMANGSRLEGTLVRYNDFMVILTLADGTRRTIAREDGIPKVDVDDPQEAHKAMAMKLAFEDPDNKKMHDITAYLATIK
jgi:mono/diheme cytochrome c family protein